MNRQNETLQGVIYLRRSLRMGALRRDVPSMDQWLDYVRDLALAEMTKHGLVERGWRLEFGSAFRLRGSCDHLRRVIRISGFRAVLDSTNGSSFDDTIVLGTILHEIGHALVSPTFGEKPHGPTWRAKARELGVSAPARRKRWR